MDIEKIKTLRNKIAIPLDIVVSEFGYQIIGLGTVFIALALDRMSHYGGDVVLFASM